MSVAVSIRVSVVRFRGLSTEHTEMVSGRNATCSAVPASNDWRVSPRSCTNRRKNVYGSQSVQSGAHPGGRFVRSAGGMVLPGADSADGIQGRADSRLLRA